MDQFAPVILVAYNRLDHFKLTLSSLKMTTEHAVAILTARHGRAEQMLDLSIIFPQRANSHFFEITAGGAGQPPTVIPCRNITRSIIPKSTSQHVRLLDVVVDRHTVFSSRHVQETRVG